MIFVLPALINHVILNFDSYDLKKKKTFHVDNKIYYKMVIFIRKTVFKKYSLFFFIIYYRHESLFDQLFLFTLS